MQWSFLVFGINLKCIKLLIDNEEILKKSKIFEIWIIIVA